MSQRISKGWLSFTGLRPLDGPGHSDCRPVMSYPEDWTGFLLSGERMSQSSEVRIGELIRFYRQAKGKTQAVIAGLAGVSEDYLSQIERGLKTPTIALLHRFAKILVVRISDLLGESAGVREEEASPAG